MDTYGRLTGLVKAVRKLMAGRKEVTLPLNDPRLKGLNIGQTSTRRYIETCIDVRVTVQHAKNTITLKKEPAF
jgi:hypothetical protein